MSTTPSSAHPGGQAAWDHCRNSLGIARLLYSEGRPAALVVTACEMAVANACRTALSELGITFDHDVESTLRRLGAPGDLIESALVSGAGPARRLADAERIVAWVADYLRVVVPGRSWGH